MALLALIAAVAGALLARHRRRTQRPWALAAAAAAACGAGAVAILAVDLESQKMAARLATPLGAAWLAAGGLAAALLLRRRWAAGAATAACWLLLALGGNAWVAAALLGSLEDGVPAPVAAAWDAVAVLGGGTSLAPDGGVQLGEAGDRLRAAAALWRAGRTPLLVATGSGLFDRDGGSRDLARETAEIWDAWDVPAAAILAIPGPVNTSQEIARLAAEARARGWGRIALVSSGWHLPRALALARRHGLPADAVAADRRGRPPAAAALFLIPTGNALHDVQLWCTEVIGRLAGR